MEHVKVFLYVFILCSTTIFIKMNVKQPMHTFNSPFHSGMV